MPTYHFVCGACGHAFEEQLPMGSPVPGCPNCKKEAAKKIIKPPMVHFKGSGFYRTDSAGGKSATKEAKTTDTTKGSKESKKVDPPAKPA